MLPLKRLYDPPVGVVLPVTCFPVTFHYSKKWTLIDREVLLCTFSSTAFMLFAIKIHFCIHYVIRVLFSPCSHWHHLHRWCHLHHCGQMLTKCKFWREELQLWCTFLQEREVPSVVNPVHRVLSPTVNHLHKVLREKDGESLSFSVEWQEKEKINKTILTNGC